MHASSLRALSAVLLLVMLSGCAVTGIRESPWQWGYGFQYAPQLWLDDDEESDRPAVHATFSYTRLSFTGGQQAGQLVQLTIDPQYLGNRINRIVVGQFEQFAR